MSNKKRLINYTSRDFNSIKSDLEEHAKRYYPDNFKDFSENSFGSFMLDTVSYIGDMLSFYLDYQVNESFLDTAVEYSNIRKLAGQEGYSGNVVSSVVALCSFYIIVPAASTGLGPDYAYIPILKKGATISSANNTFLLHDDVDFSDAKNEVVAARFSDQTGKPTFYAIRAQGVVVSSNRKRVLKNVGEFERFKKIKVGETSISDIISIVDSDGNEYFKVNHLAQDIIYIDTTNKNAKLDGVPSILKRKIVPRRFITTREVDGFYIQFGSGSEETVETTSITEPQQAVLNFIGRPYITDSSFDPSEMLGTKSMGVSPSNTTLSIVYEENDSQEVSIAPGELSRISEYEMVFPNRSRTSSITKESSVIQSIEVANDEQISHDTTPMSSEEIKTAAMAAKFTQLRAVTRQDYESLAYLMPKRFGSIKRATIINDPSATNRRLSFYVVSADSSGNLQITNTTVKSNLRTWLQSNKMLNDMLDIYDARIVNFGFDFKVVVDPTQDKIEVLSRAITRLKRDFAEKLHIGEPFYLTSVFNSLNKVDGIIDTLEVKPKLITGNGYNTAPISMEQLKSKDGTYLIPSRNMVLEIKNFDKDISGVAL